ncbi:MAG TPA: photosystem reaction center subunit H [Cyanobacteria bacterium UBA11369]|nr:photosystem reaction center subunit H [Cyanobacteria bacterium UBA8553]HAZ46373.1 photosystem reaction center subunit H [Cyanobacteria bacterium UBA11371]HBE34347.1 photosystem reaction center subunit H [Cyanobacteria bacterium UBA11368]HBE47644.1 photosystem reaction center subunit H [Cyanobacteria bacterium UBA11369]
MALYKLEDFNPNYRQDAFDGEDVKGLPVYAGKTDEKIGTIHNVLVDETGRFRYFVIDTGFWIFGKKVLLPVGRCSVDVEYQRINAIGITSKEQAERLPEYDDSMTVDYDYEERVRGVYRTPTVEATLPVEASPRVETAPVVSAPVAAAYDRNTYTYEHEPELYQMSDRDHQKFRLYEEKLIVDKSRRKTGEVTIGKRVETETVRTAIPVEKERVIIERTTPKAVDSPVFPDNTAFKEGNVAQMAIYEETADIKKQAFVREEVDVRKEVTRDTVEATETLRHEELDVDTRA